MNEAIEEEHTNNVASHYFTNDSNDLETNGKLRFIEVY
jgi:hypothetical protein